MSERQRSRAQVCIAPGGSREQRCTRLGKTPKRFDAACSWLPPGAMKALLLCLLLCLPATAYAQSDAEHQQFLFAYKLLQRNEVKEAAAAFDEYLGKFPNGDKLGDAQYYRALLHRKAGDNRKAAALLARASKPTLVPGYALKLLSGQAYSDLGEYKQALASLELIDTDELPAKVAVSALYLKGLAYRGAENLPAAATALADAAELDTPMKPRALLDLAKVQAQMKDNQQALASLAKCLKLEDPATAPEAARFAGDLSYNAGQYDKAVGYYTTVISRYQSSKHFAPSQVGLMWARFANDEHEAVLKTYDQAAPTLPARQRATADYLAGSAHQELGQHEQARPLLQRVAEGQARPSIREKALYKLAVSLSELGEYAQLQAAAAALLERFPQTDLRADVAFLQASADAESGEVEKGVARLTELIRQGPSAGFYGPALLRRAHLYEKHGKLEAAVQDYDTYLDTIDKPNRTAMQTRLRLMELLGALARHERVIELAQDILTAEDTAPVTPEIQQEALYRLAVAHRFAGDLNKAMATHKQLMQQHPLNPYAAESGYEQGLIWMTQGEADQGVPMLLDAADNDKLDQSSRLSAMRVVAQHDVDRGNDDRALKLRLKMQLLAGPEVFSDDERLWLGRALIERGESRRAVGYLSDVQAESKQERAKLLIGRAYRHAGEMDKALAALNEVRAVSERYNVDAWLEIAKVYRDQGKLDEALRELAALQNPDRGQRIASQAMFEAGLIHKHKAIRSLRTSWRAAEPSYIAGRDAFKKLWLLYPDRDGEDLAKRAYLHLAALQHAMGQDEEEIQTLTELIEAEPQTPEATLAKAVLAERAGKRERADAYMRQVLNEAGGDSALSRLAGELIQRGD